MKSRSEKSIKNISYTLIGQMLGLLISFFSRSVFIRVLGTEYLGLNGLFTNILTILSLTELGIGEAITFSLYLPLAEKNEKKCLLLMNLYKKVYIFTGIIIMVLGLLITPFISFFINDIPDISNIHLIFMLFVINTAITYFYSYKKSLLIADQKKYITVVYRYLFYFLLNVVQIIFLLINHNYILFLVIQIVFNFFENYFLSLKANKVYPFLLQKTDERLDVDSKKQIVKNTKAMMLHKIGGVVVNATDNIILTSFVNLTAVGLYSNYNLIISALSTIFSQIFTSIMASVGNSISLCSSEKNHELFKNIFFANFWIYSFSSVCLINLINPFISLWLGREYLLGWNVIIILVVNYFLNGMRKTVIIFKEAAGLFSQDKWKAVVEALVNLILSIILVVKFGVFGVFLGTFLSLVLVSVWIEPFVLYKYYFKSNVIEYFKLFSFYSIITIVLSFVTYSIVNFISISNVYISFVVISIISFLIPNLIIFVCFRKSNSFIYFYNIAKNFIKGGAK